MYTRHCFLLLLSLQMAITNPESPETWQRDLKCPGERLAALLGSSKMSDVEIFFKGKHGSIKAHRLVLGMSSPVFENLFYGDRPVSGELFMHDDDPDAFAWMLTYFYSNKKDLPSPEVAINVASLAIKYQVDVLASVCSQYLIKHLEENFAQIYNAALEYKYKDILKECAKIVQERPGSVLAPPVLLKLDVQAVSHLLQNIQYIDSEIKLLRAVIVWGKCQLEKKHKDVTKSSLRQQIDPLLPHIRFLTMSSEELTSKVMALDIFTPDEICNICIAVSDPDAEYELPSICCKIKEKRSRFHEAQLKSIILRVEVAGVPMPGYAGETCHIISGLKTSKTVYLHRIEIEGLDTTNMTATIRDPSDQTVKVINFPVASGEFGELVTLYPGMSITISATLNSSCNYTSGKFCYTPDGVIFKGVGLYENPATVYYWC